MSKQVCRALLAACCLMMLTGFAAAQKSRKSVPASEVNGTFRMGFTGKYKGSYNEIKILALGGGKLHVAMDLTYPYTMPNGDLMANTGQLDDRFAIDGDVAAYDSTQFGTCSIRIKFVTPGTIKVTQQGDDAACGFGRHVFSEGTYKRVSSLKPKFDAQR